MCGIAGIIARNDLPEIRTLIGAMSAAIAHRGPDGEGFILSDLERTRPLSRNIPSGFSSQLNYLPASSLQSDEGRATIAIAHRRLSIIDLSEAGHEPMCDEGGGCWLSFNGEIYNYRELREELGILGYRFRSHCDAEVLLYAYREWGTACVEKFNGMWAFALLDTEKKLLFMSRDRLGVKPLYYSHNSDLFCFASEQKAFIRAGLVPLMPDARALHNYLVNTALEREENNFFAGIRELWPGHNVLYDLQTHTFTTRAYFHLESLLTLKNNDLSDGEIISQVREKLDEAIKLRLRSDVEAGTCLSGGIDSSAIAVTAASMLGHPLHCFTAGFKGQAFDETPFARLVAEKIDAIHHITEPGMDGFFRDLDELVYSQDVPIWDSSTYAQHCVMRLAQENNIKVVLDGQGADEMFTGYLHHYTAKWNGYMKQGRMSALFKDMQASQRTVGSAMRFYMKERMKGAAYSPLSVADVLLKKEFVRTFPAENPYRYESDVNRQLLDDIGRTRLKIFLKCEDRCGMWHGVESRTPFSDDISLISFLFSFDGARKVRNGRLKYFLREAVKDRLPRQIYERPDKKGFETPMLKWIAESRSRMEEEIKGAGFTFVREENLTNSLKSAGTAKLFFRLFVLARWMKVFKG